MSEATREREGEVAPARLAAELRTAARYALFQLPGVIAVALLLAALARAEVVTLRTALLLAALWIAKEAALYPLLRDAYRGADPGDTARLVGRRGVVRQRLAPRGWVFVGGALWRAQVAEGAAPIDAGHEVRVLRASGHRLTVVAAPEAGDS